MIRRTTMMLAAAGTVAILAGSMALAGSASAASLPSCATNFRCTSNTPGESHGAAGYYGADDNHTNYRFVQTEVTATPQLVNLNGSTRNPGGVGVQLCDPSTGRAAQISLGYVGGAYVLSYAVGFFGPGSSGFGDDPCIQTGFIKYPFPGHSGTFGGINAGDTIYLALYYDPSGTHRHQIAFGACDLTQGLCSTVWSGTVFSQSFTEFGIGAFSNRNNIQGGAINKFETFSNNRVTCYSCAASIPITSVSPVNPFGIGGLYEAQFVNEGSQVQMSPNDTLTATSFNMYNGSTGSH